MLSLDQRVTRVVANCTVVDWSILDEAEKAETSKTNYADYIRQAFGNGYRLSDANWRKLRSGTFHNPWHHRTEIDGSKVLMFDAKDDPNVPYDRTRQFAELTVAALKSIKKGGHISTDYVVRKYWAQIKRFFDSAAIPVRQQAFSSFLLPLHTNRKGETHAKASAHNSYCVFLLCPPFLRKSSPPKIPSAPSTSAAMNEQRESYFVPPKKCPRRITASSPSILYALMDRSSDISPMPSIFSAPRLPERKILT